MTAEFQPAFKNFQADIERYIISIGKCEKSKDGFTIFRGYEDALKLMFRRYLDGEAFDPLVSYFRRWNWEWSYNDFLIELTTALSSRRDWPRLQLLWDSVVAKRKKNYNEIWKIEKDKPGAISSKTVAESKELLLDTLKRVIAFAEEFGGAEESAKYSVMIDRVRRGRKA